MGVMLPVMTEEWPGDLTDVRVTPGTAHLRWHVGPAYRRSGSAVANVLTLPALSTDYVLVTVAAYEDGVAVDPVTAELVAEMAFPAPGVQPSTWYSAEWELTVRGQWAARCLVGPQSAGAAPPAGTYDIWVRVTGADEEPVRQARTALRVT